jgi:GTPase
MNLPVIVLVGRPNVGKSTLFNRLCETRRALMSDIPGTTRDWQEGRAHWNGREFRVIDTGGYTPGEDVILSAVRAQVDRWVREADVTLWVVDGGEGLAPADQSLGGWMRQRAKNVVVAVNKIDDPKREDAVPEFHRLGYSDVIAVSSSHGRNIHGLLGRIEELCPEQPAPPEEDASTVRVSLVGRPNVGKSSTLNALLGEDRMIVSDVPGTTRDAVDTLLERDGRRFLLIDTAGLRHAKAKSAHGLEGLTRIMAEKALERAEVAVLLIDAAEGFRDGDVAVGRLIDRENKACVIGVNKWDLVANRPATAQRYRDGYSQDLPFLAYAPIVFYSAKTGHHVPELLQAVSQSHEAYHRSYDAEDISAFFWRQVQERPYSHGGRKLIFHGAEQVSSGPTTLVLRSNMSDTDVHFSYRRHLDTLFRKRHNLAGAPLILKFKRGRK